MFLSHWALRQSGVELLSGAWRAVRGDEEEGRTNIIGEGKRKIRVYLLRSKFDFGLARFGDDGHFE